MESPYGSENNFRVAGRVRSLSVWLSRGPAVLESPPNRAAHFGNYGGPDPGQSARKKRETAPPCRPSDVIAPFTAAFRQGLRELGYVEKKDYILEIRSGSAATDRLFDLAAELVRMRVEVIVTVGSPALKAAAKATSTTPIVMRIGGDPVKSGLVASFARPAGNITGLFARSVELSGKRLELLAEVVPGIKRIAVLTASSNFEATNEYKDLESAARVLGVKLQILRARDPDTIDSAFAAMSKDRAQALVQIPHALYTQNAARADKVIR